MTIPNAGTDDLDVTHVTLDDLVNYSITWDGDGSAPGVIGPGASRVATMAGRGLLEPVAFTGGVAMVPGMEVALAAALGKAVIVVDDPQMTGALGAAILAAR